jgi:hypothetical protein
MGANASCPQDFEKGIGFFCRHTCPPKFKYAQEGGQTGPPEEYCVYMHNNEYKIKLTGLLPPHQKMESSQYMDERNRVRAEYRTLGEKIATEQPVYDTIQDIRGDMAAHANAYSQIKTEYAKYAEPFENQKPESLKDLVQTLKPLRAPTAPASDLSIVRKGILESSSPNFLLIQVELAILILCLLAYSFLPLQYAQGAAVVILSVGVAVGIFLWK